MRRTKGQVLLDFLQQKGLIHAALGQLGHRLHAAHALLHVLQESVADGEYLALDFSPHHRHLAQPLEEGLLGSGCDIYTETYTYFALYTFTLLQVFWKFSTV